MHKEWFEPVLAHQLDRVRAPEELWERVRSPRVAPRVVPRVAKRKRVHMSVNAAGMSACATVLLLGIWLFVGRTSVRSGDAGEIRAFVKAKAGIDLPLRKQSDGVQLTGARVAKGSVEVAYRVGKRDGRLLVGGSVASGGPRVFTWSMDGHTYTLECATPEDLKIACNLCHIG
jgi:hypothetical protein